MGRGCFVRTGQNPGSAHGENQTAVLPPSTASLAPWMKLARSVARNTIASAISSAVAGRRAGASAANRSRSSPIAAAPSVRVGPGSQRSPARHYGPAFDVMMAAVEVRHRSGGAAVSAPQPHPEETRPTGAPQDEEERNGAGLKLFEVDVSAAACRCQALRDRRDSLVRREHGFGRLSHGIFRPPQRNRRGTGAGNTFLGRACNRVGPCRDPAGFGAITRNKPIKSQ